MQWVSEQIEQYISSPQFFDTAIIPCYRIALTEDALEVVKHNEEQYNRVLQVEERLKGRIVLFPAIVLWGNQSNQFETVMEAVTSELQRFPHVFYLPFDKNVVEQIQAVVKNFRGKLLSTDQQVDWYTEILTNWREK